MFAQHRYFVPGDQDGQGEYADQQGAPLQVRQGSDDTAEGVLAMGTDKVLAAEFAQIKTDGIGKLLEDDNDADSRENALNDGGREKIGHDARTDNT